MAFSEIEAQEALGSSGKPGMGATGCHLHMRGPRSAHCSTVTIWKALLLEQSGANCVAVPGAKPAGGALSLEAAPYQPWQQGPISPWRKSRRGVGCHAGSGGSGFPLLAVALAK